MNDELESGRPSDLFLCICGDHDVLPSDPCVCALKSLSWSKGGTVPGISVLDTHTTVAYFSRCPVPSKALGLFVLFHLPAHIQEKASLGPLATECVVYMS